MAIIQLRTTNTPPPTPNTQHSTHPLFFPKRDCCLLLIGQTLTAWCLVAARAQITVDSDKHLDKCSHQKCELHPCCVRLLFSLLTVATDNGHFNLRITIGGLVLARFARERPSPRFLPPAPVTSVASVARLAKCGCR